MVARLNGSSASKLNVWLNLMVGVGTVVGFLISALIVTSNVTQKFTETAARVEAVSTKVDNASQLSEKDVKALALTVDRNHQDVLLFQTQATEAFKRIFDGLQKQNDALVQERVDRITEQSKTKKP